MKKNALFKIQWISAVTIPLSIMWMIEFICFEDAIPRFIENLEPRIVRTLLAFIPFLSLMVFTKVKIKQQPYDNIRSGLTWATILVLTSMILIWGIYVLDCFTRFLGGGSVGGPLRLALILFPSPIYEFVLMVGAYSFGQYISKRVEKN